LLLVPGNSDVNTPIPATGKIAESLTQAKRPFDLIVLPEQPRSFEVTSTAHVREAMARWFREHLKP
jgi:dipeptidyl aminopeptidase/acylaminoacyl peptidase